MLGFSLVLFLSLRLSGEGLPNHLNQFIQCVFIHHLACIKLISDLI